jgi:hypothetical protein
MCRRYRDGQRPWLNRCLMVRIKHKTSSAESAAGGRD